MDRMPSSVKPGRRSTVRALLGYVAAWQRDATTPGVHGHGGGPSVQEGPFSMQESPFSVQEGPFSVQEGPSVQAVLSLKVLGPTDT